MFALLLTGVLQVSAAFELAAAVPDRFVDITCVLYDRHDGRWCENQAGATLKTGDYSVSDLTALTKHRNPRVRTLALVTIAERGDPKLLPLVMTLTKDQAGTYPAHLMVAHTFGGNGANAPRQAQTVGDVAEAIMRFYIEPAGYSYGSSNDGDCPAFDQYWELRKDRTELASWLTVQLYRATQRTSPIQPGREARFAALRRRIEQLSGDERLWYSLHIGASEGGHRVLTHAETLAAARAIGPDRLMAMLDAKEPAFDPDLVPRGRPASCGSQDIAADMRRFVLTNAAALLRPSDADALLRLPDAKLSLWSVAAASLRPDIADTILKPRIEALDRRVFGWDQAHMAVALVRIGGDVHAAYALDWFYSRRPDEPVTNAQEIFINDVVEWSGLGGRALLHRVIADRRFDEISVPALRRLVSQINNWLPAPIVQYPYQSVTNETQTHAEWRRLVRDSAPRWTKP